MNPRLSALRAEFDTVRAGIDTIEAAAAKRGDDLTDAEQADVDKLYARAEQLGAEIEPLAKRESSISATADVLARLGVGRPAPAHSRAAGAPASKLPTAGEYFSLFARAHDGDRDAGDELHRALVGLDRAVADQTTGDLGAILPEPIVGQLVSLLDSTRPVFESFTPRPMPQLGKTFTRPRITQHVNVDEQTTEKTQLASRKMTLAEDSVTKRTFGGVLDISQQSIDWTDPALLDIALADFIAMYGVITEAEACDALEALPAAGVEGSWLGTNVGTVVTSITNAVGEVYDNAKRMPDTMWLDLASALSLASLTNDDDSVTAIEIIRRALSEVGIPIKFVVGPGLAANTRILGCKSLVESYEQRKGLVQAINVPLFGLDVAYAGYVAFWGRTEGFLNLIVDPTP